MLNRIGSALTMQQIAGGDVANILRNVRWQRDLFRTLPKLSTTRCATELVATSEHFINAYGLRKASNGDYPRLVESQLKCLMLVAQEREDNGLREHVGVIEKSIGGELAKLQRAHQDYLARLDDLSRASPSTG